MEMELRAVVNISTFVLETAASSARAIGAPNHGTLSPARDTGTPDHGAISAATTLAKVFSLRNTVTL